MGAGQTCSPCDNAADICGYQMQDTLLRSTNNIHLKRTQFNPNSDLMNYTETELYFGVDWQLEKLATTLGKDNLGLYLREDSNQPMTIEMPSTCMRGKHFLGHLNEESALEGVCQHIQIQIDKESKMGSKTFEFGNFKNGHKEGYGIQIQKVTFPEKSVFILYVGDFLKGEIKEGFVVCILKYHTKVSDMLNSYFFRGRFKNGLESYGFRKMLSGNLLYYLGNFTDGIPNGIAQSLIVKNQQKLEYWHYKGDHLNGKKNGHGKLAKFQMKSDIELKRQKIRQAQILELVQDKTIDLKRSIALLLDLNKIQFPKIVPEDLCNVHNFTGQWVSGMLNGLVEITCKELSYRFIGMYKNDQRNGYGEEETGQQKLWGFYKDGKIDKSIIFNNIYQIGRKEVKGVIQKIDPHHSN